MSAQDGRDLAAGGDVGARAMNALAARVGSARDGSSKAAGEGGETPEYFELYFGNWGSPHAALQRSRNKARGAQGEKSASPAQTSQGGRFFSSDLSVDESILVKQAGYEPISFVKGSCVYHTGMPYIPYGPGSWGGGMASGGMGQGAGGGQGAGLPQGGLMSGIGMEIQMLSAAMHNARRTALNRLAGEGQHAGGSGVVGVRLLVNPFSVGEAGSSTSRFLALGTAIRRMPVRGGTSDDARGSAAGVQGAQGVHHSSAKGVSFFSSHLSGQDFYLLVKAGYMPIQVVMGSCVYYVRTRSFATTVANRQNMEIEAYTRALYEARELAMGRMQDEAVSCGSDGVVGVTVEESSHGWGGSHTIEFFAMGTAISQIAREHIRLIPRLTVPLEDEIIRTSPTAMHKEG
ncbi:MAG: heavy metal-binding domain-containing protein [Actinobacteria bacterium]|nr:heavy metal-binding domain-containing protein [Actinomycetota bacterium]